MSEQGPKERLLAKVIDHVAGHGVTGLSLRDLATAVGTSHRMLIHHFGSKEGLLVEVVKAVEEQQRQALEDLSPAAFWERLTDPALDRQERLFFELYGQALQGRPWAASLLDGIVDDWLVPLETLLGSKTDARLALAVARGLLLDLLATGDKQGVTKAMHRFQTLILGARPN
jgi:AcrR family transcriptional regulator